MKCPCCEREMQKGYFRHVDQPVQWIPNGKKPSIFRFSAADDGVKLSNKFSMGGYDAEAYYCDACHVVIAKAER